MPGGRQNGPDSIIHTVGCVRILVVLHRSLILFHYQSEEHGFVNSRMGQRGYISRNAQPGAISDSEATRNIWNVSPRMQSWPKHICPRKG
jgi:hypothetical protein